MRLARPAHSLLLTLAFVAGGCCTSSAPAIGDDGADTLPDGGEQDTAAEMAMAVCGNNLPEAGEACDDGNTVSGDGCSADCLSTEICGNDYVDYARGEQCDDGNALAGDGCTATCLLETCGNLVPDPGEACDDGNLMSGDGCSADCSSAEICGNRIVDVASGELCDDGNTMGGDGCSADCRVVEGCSNGVVDPGEQCDDGNLVAHDGCGPDCHSEQAVIADTLVLAGGTVTCDVDGNGTLENAFGTAVPAVALDQINGQIQMAIAAGDLIMLMAFLGLDDVLGVNDPRLRLAQYQGLDGDAIGTNNTAGGSLFFIPAASLNAMGLPITAMDSSIAASALIGGPEDINIDIPAGGAPVRIALRRGQIFATVVNDGMKITNLDAGILCGGIPVLALYNIANPAPLGGATMLDMLTSGLGGFGTPAQPDLDLDFDGVETFTDTDGNDTVDTCTDGNGTTVVTGEMCPTDPRFADGYSAAFQFTAIWAEIIGVM